VPDRVCVGTYGQGYLLLRCPDPYHLAVASQEGAMVSDSGVCARRIMVDARHHMLGRLSSIIAKELLNGQKAIVVHCEEICLSAGLACQEVI
jgi:hypothetical protein